MTELPSPRSEFVDELLRDIVASMVEIFNVSEQEATGRTAWEFQEMNLTDEFTGNYIGHADPEFWAKSIYYGPSVDWWNRDENQLEPRPWS